MRGSRQEAHRACACQQKLERLLKDLEETQNCCEALTRQLDSTKLQSKETVTKHHLERVKIRNLGEFKVGLSLQEDRFCAVEKDLALKEACWLETEAELQQRITSLEKELELEREQHNKEVQKPLTFAGWCHVAPSNLKGPAQPKQLFIYSKVLRRETLIIRRSLLCFYLWLHDFSFM